VTLTSLFAVGTPLVFSVPGYGIKSGLLLEIVEPLVWFDRLTFAVGAFALFSPEVLAQPLNKTEKAAITDIFMMPFIIFS
jgi:hypothetical protein